MLEGLESRRYCARVTLLQDAFGVLNITGTSGNDSIEIGSGRHLVTLAINGSTGQYSIDGVKAIRILGGRGNDLIVVSPNLPVRVSADGGEGNDSVGGGAANDTLSGGAGNDFLAGHGGQDYFDGGTGDDVMYDVQGINVFHGGGGDDKATDEGYALGSGVERWVSNGDLRNSSDFFLTGSTDLKTVNGRLILSRTGNTGTSSDITAATGPTGLPSGQFEVTESYSDEPGGAILGSYTDTWDVTDAAAHGLVFTFKPHPAGRGGLGEGFSVVFLVPQK